MLWTLKTPISFFIIGFVCLLAVNSIVSGNEKIEALPTPKIESFSNSYITIPKNVELISEDSLHARFKAAIDSLQQSLQKNSHDQSQKLVILFSKISDFSTIDQKYKAELSKSESYMLTIGVNQISVISRDNQGLLNGLSTLEALIEKYKGKLPQGRIVDYPDTKMRVLHLSLWPCSKEDFKEAIKLARIGHYNALIWLNHYGVKLKSLEHLTMKNKNRWSIAELQEMVEFVKENGMEVIPSLALLSNQTQFLGNIHPEFMYNKTTYDPRKEGLYENVIFPAIDELITLTGATKFHIGHDEVVGWDKNHYKENMLLENEKQLSPELFLQDVLTIHDYLRKKGIETWMWGDMLLSKEEFPSMKKSGASINGYNGYAALRTKIPKDIVICDWHYREQISFPTALTFANEGYKVLGATWTFRETTIDFTKYMNKLPKNAEGMIATTWYGLNGPKKEEVSNTIKFSANEFWNAN